MLQGTENLLKACLAAGVCRLVYTSTYNVVYGGQEIINGDESIPYWPVQSHADEYSRSKALAEMAVLAANGTPLSDAVQQANSKTQGAQKASQQQVAANGKQPQPDVFRTCAVRPAAIYGPGEQRIVPRIVELTQQGKFKFVFGRADSLVDWTHVDNLVQAQVSSKHRH